MSGKAENIEQLAADWITRQSSGTWTEADQAEFDAWVAQSTAHRIAYVRLDTAWNRVGRLQALVAGAPAGSVPSNQLLREAHFPYRATEETILTLSESGAATDAPRRLPHKSNRWITRKLPLAAAGIVVACIGFYLYFSSDFTGHRYSTPIGAMNIVPLKDGTHITLNTDTHLRVALENTERRIELDRGEAFFDVAKDPARPFIVVVGDKRVIAVGTQFSVRRDGDNVRVAVAEGKVRIEAAKRQESSVRQARTEALLIAGSVADTEGAGIVVHDHASPEVEQRLSWRQGVIALHETPLAEAVSEFNRYNDRKIVIRDAGIENIEVGGSFKSTNADAFLWMLHRGFSISVERTETEVILRRSLIP